MTLSRCALVDVTFSVDGIVGREAYRVTVIDRPQPLIRAWGALEHDLINEGLTTFECGCCLAPESGVKLLEMRERA